MTTALVSDTHSVIWYLGNLPQLSTNAEKAMDATTAANEPLYVSAISPVEMTYLIEKDRLPRTDLSDLLKALRNKTSSFRLAPVNLAVTRALRKVPRTEVPDMPDRIIAATALYLGVPIVTRDGKTRASGLTTIW